MRSPPPRPAGSPGHRGSAFGRASLHVRSRGRGRRPAAAPHLQEPLWLCATRASDRRGARGDDARRCPSTTRAARGERSPVSRLWPEHRGAASRAPGRTTWPRGKALRGRGRGGSVSRDGSAPAVRPGRAHSHAPTRAHTHSRPPTAGPSAPALQRRAAGDRRGDRRGTEGAQTRAAHVRGRGRRWSGRAGRAGPPARHDRARTWRPGRATDRRHSPLPPPRSALPGPPGRSPRLPPPSARRPSALPNQRGARRRWRVLTSYGPPAPDWPRPPHQTASGRARGRGGARAGHAPRRRAGQDHVTRRPSARLISCAARPAPRAQLQAVPALTSFIREPARGRPSDRYAGRVGGLRGGRGPGPGPSSARGRGWGGPGTPTPSRERDGPRPGPRAGLHPLTLRAGSASPPSGTRYLAPRADGVRETLGPDGPAPEGRAEGTRGPADTRPPPARTPPRGASPRYLRLGPRICGRPRGPGSPARTAMSGRRGPPRGRPGPARPWPANLTGPAPRSVCPQERRPARGDRCPGWTTTAGAVPAPRAPGTEAAREPGPEGWRPKWVTC